MVEEIKEILKKEPEVTCYAIAKAIGKSPTNATVAKNYWKAKYELLLEQTQASVENSLEGTICEEAYQEGVPDQWTDKEGRVYIKGAQSGTWRVYPNGLEFGHWEDIDEHKVKARYVMETL